MILNSEIKNIKDEEIKKGTYVVIENMPYECLRDEHSNEIKNKISIMDILRNKKKHNITESYYRKIKN